MLASISLAYLITTALAQEDSPVHRVECPRQVVLPMLPTARQSPLIELEIGGQKYKFALDTGAVGGRISAEVVKRLGLKPEGKVMAGDPSGKNSREVSLYRIPQVKAAGATLYGVQMMVEDGVVPKGAPAYFDGVIGYAVFCDLLLTLDYPNRQVILTPGGMSPDQVSRSIPYQLEHGIPLLSVQIGDVKVGGHVDSGSDGGLSIPAKYKDRLHLEGEPRKVGQAKTLFNTTDIYLAKVKDPIYVGGIKMPIDQVEINDLFPFANIGGRLLHKFRVTIDQRKRRILFEA
ncbi:MAG: retropepsin-like aspartic protease [Fimbriimonadales bacterium]